MHQQIIKYFTDNDLYAFTMSYAGQRYNNVVEDVLIIRKNFRISQAFLVELRRQIDMFKNIVLTDAEADGMINTCYYLPRSFIEWLKTYRYDPSEVKVWSEDHVLKLKITGVFYRTVFWETPLMALISELFFKFEGKVADQNYLHRAQQKGVKLLEIGARYSEFGTRRRFSYEVQKNVIKALINSTGLVKNGGVLVGTSNVHFALLNGIIPTGTNGHKWTQLHAGLYGVRMANRMATKVWEEAYGTYLGTALTDTYTTKEFLSTFSRHDAMLYESVRQDSGDPLHFVDEMVKFYKKLAIDPLSKTILFSDSLNIKTVETITNYCSGKIKCAFGIGTYLSNDILGVEPLKIVIKQVGVWLDSGRRIGTCKISDDISKSSGEDDVIHHTLFELGLS